MLSGMLALQSLSNRNASRFDELWRAIVPNVLNRLVSVIGRQNVSLR